MASIVLGQFNKNLCGEIPTEKVLRGVVGRKRGERRSGEGFAERRYGKLFL
jgi:hypothetical protein